MRKLVLCLALLGATSAWMIAQESSDLSTSLGKARIQIERGRLRRAPLDRLDISCQRPVYIAGIAKEIAQLHPQRRVGGIMLQRFGQPHSLI